MWMRLKKIKHQALDIAVERVKRSTNTTVTQVCSCFKLNRDAWYKYCRRFITYIRTVKGFCYLALITDLYSRKIVGYDVSDSLELAGCLRAFQIAQRQAHQATVLIHHSDRGAQYCSHPYVKALKKRKIQISMTEEKHFYENAVIERVNGILKDEFYFDQCLASTELARLATKNAIKTYNEKRLHISLGYKTPESVFEYQVNLNVKPVAVF